MIRGVRVFFLVVFFEGVCKKWVYSRWFLEAKSWFFAGGSVVNLWWFCGE
jgi:hypothetical protein